MTYNLNHTILKHIQLKKITFVLTFLISIVTSGQTLAELYRDINSSVVVIDIINVSRESEGEYIQVVTEESQGSGVLIAEEGLIWTAAHVVQTAEEVQIEFLDGDIYAGTVISSVAQADVALVKIKGDFLLKDKKVAPIGDSDKVFVGEDVFVLGAPHGFKQSLSRGILSGRFVPAHLSNDFVKIEFLQTDASINPGNSGGPMFNMSGEVIGIASRIYSNSGGFEGIGFAMSSNVADKLLMQESSIWGGMESLLLDGDLAKALNLPQEAGLLITSLSSKGSASALGLKGGTISAKIEETELKIGGDIILELGGITIEDINSIFKIRKIIAEAQKGDVITMTIFRNGKIVRAKFTKQD
ncbi:trypsin-like peptidase domain-containing protein [uncultured Eudoraea sp.]|uniref:S1C family serine protease n=1 Tax=uncultured Eudoraea sp. TaxID=1035614 RepID=UPI00262D6518|nr:trypsin-like peptidase domain-containing protein [uncultured Eudoraea sp.]